MLYTPQRLDKVHKAMKREGIDALVIARRADVHYLTGYEPISDSLPVGCIIVPEAQPVLIVSDLQERSLEGMKMLAHVRTFSDNGPEESGAVHSSRFWKCVLDVLKEHNMSARTIGLQLNWLPVREFEALKSSLPSAGFKDFTDAIWKLRQLKDTLEIDAIRKAVKVAEIGIRTALEIVVPGKSGIDASVEIESVMRSAGGQPRGIRAAVLTGKTSHMPFAQPTAERIQKNDLTIIDITVSHAGYFAELARTLHPGSPSRAQRSVFEAALEASRTMESIMVPGRTLKEITDAVMAKVQERDSSLMVVPILGSSIGLDLIEPPRISDGSDLPLREGMVFSIHPTVYQPGVGGARLADVVVLSADRCENLTLLSRETM